MNAAIKIRPAYYLGTFIGFSCWLPRSKEYSTPCDYKSLVLMNRRAMADADARPIETVRTK